MRKHFKAAGSSDCVERMNELTLKPGDSDNEEMNEYLGGGDILSEVETHKHSKNSRKIKKARRKNKT